jgi:hypothetical protein
VSTMIERVGAALRDCEASFDGTIPWLEHAARAAIAAMREPTDKMRAVNGANWGRRTWSEYQAMIDAALEETQ